MSLHLKPGDFVRHSRLGTARVVEVCDDRVIVAPRNGERLQVSATDAERNLLSVPADGFSALLFQRQVSGDFLRDNIEDVVLRVMRDRRRHSITVQELRREFQPILDRDQKNWTSWWGSARKKLLVSGKIKVDPKKKNVLLSERVASPTPDEWIGQLATVRSAASLLAASRDLEIIPENNRIPVVQAVANAVSETFRQVKPDSQEWLELICAVGLLLPYVEKSSAESLLSAIDPKAHSSITVPPELETDLCALLSHLAKSAPQKATEFALLLLPQSSPSVSSKAFSILNTDKTRDVLKRALLDWINQPDAATISNLPLYLRDEFLKQFRDGDIKRLYGILLERPELADNPVGKAFLARFADRMFPGKTDDLFTVSLFSSRLISEETKRNLIRNCGDRGALIRILLNHFRRELELPVAYAFSLLQAEDAVEAWVDLLAILQSGRFSELFREVAQCTCTSLETDVDIASLSALAHIGELLRIVPDHYPEHERILTNALERFGRRLLGPPDSSILAPLMRGVQAQVDAAQRKILQEKEELQRQTSSLKSDLEAVRSEKERLSELAEMLKSSAAFDRQEVETQARVEVLRPVLLLIDELERQPGAQALGTAVTAGLETALEQAGVKRIAKIGERLSFDPSVHEFVGERESSLKGAVVSVVRAGYLLRVGSRETVIRRVLVRAQ